MPFLALTFTLALMTAAFPLMYLLARRLASEYVFVKYTPLPRRPPSLGLKFPVLIALAFSAFVAWKTVISFFLLPPWLQDVVQKLL